MFSILFLVTFICQFIIINGDDRLLNEYAMISTHDAITGEINEKRDHIVARWTQTQHGTIIDQLNCGARALDFRPYLNSDNKIYGHHGPIVIYKLMSEIINEILLWTKKHSKELVILQFSHCVDARFNNNYYSSDCEENVLSFLKDHNIHTITDCNELDTLTIEKALSYPNGNLIAIKDSCSFGYWDPSLTCYTKDYTCYESWPNDTSSVAWERMTNFTTQAASFVPVNNGFLWGFGSNWQSSAESVVLGTLHNSSLLLDEERSNINAWAAEQIRSGNWKYINQIGIDNVCHNGADLFAAVKEYNDNYAKRRANRN